MPIAYLASGIQHIGRFEPLEPLKEADDKPPLMLTPKQRCSNALHDMGRTMKTALRQNIGTSVLYFVPAMHRRSETLWNTGARIVGVPSTMSMNDGKFSKPHNMINQPGISAARPVHWCTLGLHYVHSSITTGVHQTANFHTDALQDTCTTHVSLAAIACILWPPSNNLGRHAKPGTSSDASFVDGQRCYTHAQVCRGDATSSTD